MTTNIVSTECLCAFAKLFSNAKSLVLATIDSLILALQTLKVAKQLVWLDFDDLVKQAELEAELLIITAGLDTLQAPFNLLLGYTKLFSDCAPVSSLSKVLKGVQNDIFSPLADRQFEIEQLIAALETHRREIDKLDRWIATMQDIKEAIEECGT